MRSTSSACRTRRTAPSCWPRGRRRGGGGGGAPCPRPLGARAVALREVAPAVRRIDLLDRLVPALTRIGGPGALLAEAECAAFAARDWLHGRMLRSPAPGLARGIRPDGALLVDAGTGTIGVREGHVELA